MELRDRAHRADLARPSRGGRQLPADPHHPLPQRGEPADHRLRATSRLTVQGQIGPFQAATSYLLEPAAGGTWLTNEVELETSSALLRLISPLAVPRIKAAVARNLGTLTGLLESVRPAARGNPLRSWSCQAVRGGRALPGLPGRTPKPHLTERGRSARSRACGRPGAEPLR